MTIGNLPRDMVYFRSHSEGYKKYLQKCGVKIISLEDECGSFGWMKDFLFFQLAKFERTSTMPTREILEKNGFKRGFVIWIPSYDFEKSQGWRNVTIPTHFMKTGFTCVEENYFKKWKNRVQRARKKFLSSSALLQKVDFETFHKAFKTAKTSVPSRRGFLDYHASLSKFAPEKVVNFLAKDGENIIGGLAVYDFDGKSSVHLVSFLTKQGKKLQAGTGLIDAWFRHGVESGLTYIQFDHLRDSSMTPDQQGYTTFKMNFIERVVDYKKSFFKFFW